MTTADKNLFGAVSEGTLRPQDLIPRFLRVLRECDTPANDFPFREALKTCMGDGESPIGSLLHCETLDWLQDPAEYLESETCAEDLRTISEALDDLAGDHHYFGAHPNDGALFGFWMLEETLQEIVESMARTFTVCAVADFSEEEEPETFNGEPEEEYSERLREYWENETQRLEWSAGSGQDWMNTVPEGYATECLTLAEGVLSEIGWDLGMDLIETDLEPEDYGHALAMESLGYGVGRIDDAPHDYKTDGKPVPYRDGVISGMDVPEWIKAQQNGTKGWSI